MDALDILDGSVANRETAAIRSPLAGAIAPAGSVANRETAAIRSKYWRDTVLRVSVANRETAAIRSPPNTIIFLLGNYIEK